MPWGGSTPHLGIRTIKPTEPRHAKRGWQIPPKWVTGNDAKQNYSYPPCISPSGTVFLLDITAPYKIHWYQVHTAHHMMMALLLIRYNLKATTSAVPWMHHFITLPRQQPLVVQYVIEPVDLKVICYSCIPLPWKQVPNSDGIRHPCPWIKYSVDPQIVVLAEASW